MSKREAPDDDNAHASRIRLISARCGRRGSRLV
jgi:hypothetical protein